MEKLYKIYLDEKIHPKRKDAASWFAATPASDVAIAGITGGSAYKAGKAAGLAGKTIAKNVALHTVKGASISFAGYAIYRILRGFFDKCTKQCGTLEINKPKRQLCLLNCKKLTLEKKLELLKQKKSKSETILKTENKIRVLSNKIKEYKEYLNKKGE